MITTLTTRIAGRTKSLSLGRYRHVALVLLLDVVLTAVLFKLVQNQLQARTQAQFTRQAETDLTAVQKGIERKGGSGMIRTTARVLAILGAILALALVACQTEAETRAPEEIPREARLVVGTVTEESEIVEKEQLFQPVIAYVASKLDAHGITEGQVIITTSPVEMAKLMRQGKVDVIMEGAFSSFVINKLADSESLANGWRKGLEKHGSVIFTMGGNGISSLDALKGKMIVFDHPSSTIGYFLPKGHLIKHGYKLTEKAGPNDIVAADEIGYYFAYGHERLVEAVLSGVAAAGAVKETKIEEYLEKSGHPKDALQVISTTIEVFRQVVSVRRDMDPQLKVALQEVLVGMDKTPEGQAVLKEFNKTKKFSAFGPTVDEAFQVMRQHVELVEKEIVQQ